MPPAAPAIADAQRFAIGFDARDRARVHALWDEVIDSQQWSHGEMTRRFEAAWAAWNGAGAVATAGWTGAALAALGYAGVAGEPVLCPSNTFMATPLAILAAEDLRAEAGHPAGHQGETAAESGQHSSSTEPSDAPHTCRPARGIRHGCKLALARWCGKGNFSHIWLRTSEGAPGAGNALA